MIQIIIIAVLAIGAALSFFGTRQKVDGVPQIRLPGKGIVITVLILALAAGLIVTSVYQLQEDEYAVITTFGKPSVVSTSGLKFRIPLIQRKTIVSKATQGFAIGYNLSNNASIEDESLMISVDFNFVNVDFYVEYRVTDPVKYLYNSREPVQILKMLCQSYIRDTIGLYGVDDVITTGKAEIQASIREKITARLEQEDLGISLVNIAMQDAEPPTTEVQQAFKAVETSKQEAVAEAEGQASRFRELYAEYAKFPEITRRRLFYESISTVFPDMKVIIMGKDGGKLETVLPLDSFIRVPEEVGENG